LGGESATALLSGTEGSTSRGEADGSAPPELRDADRPLASVLRLGPFGGALAAAEEEEKEEEEAVCAGLIMEEKKLLAGPDADGLGDKAAGEAKSLPGCAGEEGPSALREKEETKEGEGTEAGKEEKEEAEVVVALLLTNSPKSSEDCCCCCCCCWGCCSAADRA